LPDKKPTIKDIAAVAGVSTQTISRVLNQRPDVASTTRERVLRTMARLQYPPSVLARRMRWTTHKFGAVEDNLVREWSCRNMRGH